MLEVLLYEELGMGRSVCRQGTNERRDVIARWMSRLRMLYIKSES